MMGLDERRRLFWEQHIRNRPRESLAHELFGIYLHLRALDSETTDEAINESDDLHLSDVLRQINRQLGVEG